MVGNIKNNTGGENNTPPPQIEINQDHVDGYLTDNNMIAVSKADIAALKNGNSVKDENLTKLIAAVSDRKHGQVTKEEREKVENHFSEISGIARNEGENAFDYMTRGISNLKTKGSDNTEMLTVISKQKKEIETLSNDISTFQTKEKKHCFDNDFSSVFENEVSKYDVSPQLSKRLKQEFSQSIFNDKTDLEGNTIFRKGKKTHDNSDNSYTVKSLINSYMNDEGFSLKSVEKLEKKGQPHTSDTFVNKDKQEQTSLFQQAALQAQKESEKNPMTTFQRRKRTTEIFEKLKGSE